MSELHPPDPPLTDGDITIREQRESDAEAIIAALQDPEIPRWTTVPAPYGRAEWDWWRAESARQRAEGVGLHLAIVDGEDRLLGAVGLNSIDWEQRQCDIGYWIAAEARGRRIAGGAARLVHDWARAEFGLERLELLIHRDNLASQRAAIGGGWVDTGERRPCPRGDCLDRDDHIVFALNSR